MSGCTPGRWEANAFGHIWGSDTKVAEAECILQAPGYRLPLPGERAANARLIAAAPDLLAALKAAIEPGSHTPETWDACHAAAVAAIAKAEGRV